jgi:hypothetical protein
MDGHSQHVRSQIIYLQKFRIQASSLQNASDFNLQTSCVTTRATDFKTLSCVGKYKARVLGVFDVIIEAKHNKT